MLRKSKGGLFSTVWRNSNIYLDMIFVKKLPIYRIQSSGRPQIKGKKILHSFVEFCFYGVLVFQIITVSSWFMNDPKYKQNME